MQTEMFTQQAVEIESPEADYVVAESIAAEQFAREPRVEEDGVDWCAWWAEYAEALE